MELTFTYLPAFAARWKKLGLIDEDLHACQHRLLLSHGDLCKEREGQPSAAERNLLRKLVGAIKAQ